MTHVLRHVPVTSSPNSCIVPCLHYPVVERTCQDRRIFLLGNGVRTYQQNDTNLCKTQSAVPLGVNAPNGQASVSCLRGLVAPIAHATGSLIGVHSQVCVGTLCSFWSVSNHLTSQAIFSNDHRRQGIAFTYIACSRGKSMSSFFLNNYLISNLIEKTNCTGNV